MAKEKTKTKPIWDIFDYAELIIVFSTVCIVLLFSLFIRTTAVDGDSMNSTLIDGDYLFIRSFMYTPERGDIVVVNDISKGTYGSIYASPLVKRVIAVGGDKIRIEKGVVIVNDEALQEDYLNETMYPTDMQEITVGEHQIFIMGDNRNHSGDSRIFGPVDERCVVGKVFMRVYPFNSFKLIANPNK